VKVVILAGGLGTRLAEETEVKPKPMVEIGGRPILWHIMKHYAHYGFKEFFIALGYRGDLIKRYFLDYYNLNGNMTIDLSCGQVQMRDMRGLGFAPDRYGTEHNDWRTGQMFGAVAAR
jgi:glucose-1-phosphate cytidylyltransferase